MRRLPCENVDLEAAGIVLAICTAVLAAGLAFLGEPLGAAPGGATYLYLFFRIGPMSGRAEL